LINKVGQFSKVSLKQFKIDMKSTFGEKYSDEEIEIMYDKIQLPKRATERSSGYDIRTPVEFDLHAGEEFKFPTGIRVKIDSGWWLMCMPRSGSGMKQRVRLANTIGNVDEDYFDADNEGHIFVKVTKDTSARNIFSVGAGDAVCQAVFVPYGITYDDEASGIRTGGMGSTGK